MARSKATFPSWAANSQWKANGITRVAPASSLASQVAEHPRPGSCPRPLSKLPGRGRMSSREQRPFRAVLISAQHAKRWFCQNSGKLERPGRYTHMRTDLASGGAGKTVTLLWVLTRAGSYDFAGTAIGG